MSERMEEPTQLGARVVAFGKTWERGGGFPYEWKWPSVAAPQLWDNWAHLSAAPDLALPAPAPVGEPTEAQDDALFEIHTMRGYYRDWQKRGDENAHMTLDDHMPWERAFDLLEADAQRPDDAMSETHLIAARAMGEPGFWSGLDPRRKVFLSLLAEIDRLRAALAAPVPVRQEAVEARIECHEDVTRQGISQPCDKTAVAWRLDPEERTPYPVCAYHSRGDLMVPLTRWLEKS